MGSRFKQPKVVCHEVQGGRGSLLMDAPVVRDELRKLGQPVIAPKLASVWQSVSQVDERLVGLRAQVSPSRVTGFGLCSVEASGGGCEV